MQNEEEHFEAEMLELGQIWKRQSAIPFAYSLPANTYSDLARLDRRLTSLMQTLLPLESLRMLYDMSLPQFAA